MSRVALVDIDDTLADTQVEILKHVNDRSKKYYRLSDMTRQFRENKVDGYYEHVTDFLNRPDTVLQVPAYPYAEYCLRNLKDSGYEVHIASSRKESLHETTHLWLNRHGFDKYVDAVHPRYSIQRGFQFKVDTAKKIGAEVAFDDTLNVAEALSENGVLTYLIDKPWNKTDTKKRNIIRSESLESAIKHHLALQP